MSRRLLLHLTPFRWALVAGSLLLVVALALLVSDLPPTVRGAISGVGLVCVGVVAALSCARRSVNCVGRRRRRAWRLAAAAMGLATTSNLVTLVVDATSLPPSILTVSDVMLVVSMVIGVVGMATFPATRRRGIELLRMILDGVIIGGSVLFIASVTLFPQLLEAAADPVTGAVALILPVADLLLATLGILLFLRGTRSLALVALGFVLYAMSDLAFAVFESQATFTFGSPIDVGWMAGYVLIALAAIHPSGSGSSDSLRPREPSAVPTTVLIFAIFLAAGSVRLATAYVREVTVVSLIMWLGVLVAVAARQVLLIIDNENLREGLEHRVAERTSALRRATHRTELLLTSVGDGIYGVDEQGIVTFVNPAVARILGWQPGELIGRSAHETFHARTEAGVPWPVEDCYVMQTIRGGVSVHAENDSYLQSEGEALPVEVTVSPLSKDDEIEGAVVVFRDITQRLEVDRLKSEFLSVVSHELRTPLTAIRGSLGLLSGGALGAVSDGAKKMIKIALDGSERLTRLINDLLDIDRIESGAMPLELADHPVGELVEVAVEQVSVLASDAGIHLQTGPTPGVVHADADFVVRTLINLLGNAIKFSPSGSEVTVRTAASDGWVSFDVVDHGRGIPADKIEAIFGRFEQIDSSDAREKGGSGLGLAISRSFVERHGGEIWANSEPGVETTFTFTLPAAMETTASTLESDTSTAPGLALDTNESQSVASPESPEPPERPAPSPDPVAPIAASASIKGELDSHRPTVLVCDDDAHVVEMLCAALTHHGYRAIGVTDGERAIAEAVREQPDGILLDLIMPGTKGAEVVAALGARRETQDIPIILISGMTPDHDRQLGAATDAWLVKPLDEVRLMETIAVATAGHGSRCEVLMVEDNDNLAQVIRTLLEADGLTVQHARTAQEALDYCATGFPHLLLLDLQLPDQDGTAVVEALRRSGRLATIPLVVYSAADVAPAVREVLHLGDTIFLTKGRVSPEELEDQVLSLLDRAVGRPPRPVPYGSSGGV